MSEKPSKIAFLTGAGVSTSAGIPDFVSLSNQWDYEEDRYSVLSIPFFLQEPERFWVIYRELFDNLKDVQPTAFHRWTADLQEKYDVTVITQNIDRLHQRAGSNHVYEVHGNAFSTVCINRVCDGFAIIRPRDVDNLAIPRCPTCHEILKPGTSLFFEGVNFMQEARDAMMDADVAIIAGTSLEVGPANELPLWANRAQTPIIWVNRVEPLPAYGFIAKFTGDTDDCPLHISPIIERLIQR